MFIFDQLKREDRQIQVITLAVVAGMLLLLGGLWYVQVVSAQKYKDNMQKQTFRSVRLPASRGKICDRNGQALAQNRPRYNIDLYLEELLAPYDATNATKLDYKRSHPEVKKFTPPLLAEIGQINQSNRYGIVNNITMRASSILQTPVALNPDFFFRHLKELTYVPLTILTDLTPRQLALYYEQMSNEAAIDLNIQPVRFYPHGTAAAHLLGYVRRQDWPEDDEEITFQYYLPYWKGKTGLENAFDADLRGKAGVKWVLVNNYSYRQREEIKTPTEAGQDLYLTIDLDIQRAAEKELAHCGNAGAVVVMNVRNGDILALASSPTYDPNMFTGRISTGENARLLDERLRPTYNRATGSYHPGSIFKIITAISCLESGLNPKEVYTSLGYYPNPHIDDTAPADDYDFEKAFYKSSNSYFINYGRKAGSRRLLEVGKRFHLGESTELGIGPEASGFFPKPEEMTSKWHESDLPYACIGQAITVTPVQMAGMVSIIANGGKLYWPRVVSHLKSPDTGAIEQINSPGRLRDTIVLNPKHLDAIRHAMLMDTENPNATAYKSFFDKQTGSPKSPLLANFHVAGKTGTAQREVFGVRDHVTWFASYGPYENPRYAVIVMVEAGIAVYGGTYCAPIAQKVYEALVKSEQSLVRAQTPLALN